MTFSMMARNGAPFGASEHSISEWRPFTYRLTTSRSKIGSSARATLGAIAASSVVVTTVSITGVSLSFLLARLSALRFPTAKTKKPRDPKHRCFRSRGAYPGRTTLRELTTGVTGIYQPCPSRADRRLFRAGRNVELTLPEVYRTVHRSQEDLRRTSGHRGHHADRARRRGGAQLRR